jgi:hypothetical protein
MLNALLDTVNIDINEEGLHILTLDSTHLASLQRIALTCAVAAQVFLLEVVLRADKAFRVFKWLASTPPRTHRVILTLNLASPQAAATSHYAKPEDIGSLQRFFIPQGACIYDTISCPLAWL